jgi:KDO2-lipid IV(A) lauroyltransferase
MRRKWLKFRHRLEWLGLSLVAKFVPLLPRRVVVGLANFLSRLVFRFDTKGRAISLTNLEAAFGAQYTPAQQLEIARAAYQNFARTMCDLFWARALTKENYRRYIKVENASVLHDLKARGESIVLVCTHHGNFEWGGLAAGFEGATGSIVTERFKNPNISHFFQHCRETSGHRMIAQESSMIRLLKVVRRGGVAGLLVDLSLRPNEAATVIDAFGMKMCVTFMQSVLAQRGPAKLVPVEGISLPDGTCRVVFHPPLTIAPDATPQQIAQQCWDFFEPTIRTTPAAWRSSARPVASTSRCMRRINWST